VKGEIVPESAVRFVRDLPVPPARLWEFLTEASRLREWYGEGRIAPREGGAVSFMAGHIRGVVTGWQPEKFLGYTWNVFQPGEATVSSSEAAGHQKVSAWPVSYVEFALDAAANGTTLTLIHRPIPEAMQKQTAMDWHTYLDLLTAGLAGDFPKRADLFAKNAALYGVGMNNLKG
jgi:uncharacterized protein YndB with AHSA1/START domain